MSKPLTDDCEMVQPVALGDRQALEVLYARYQRPLFHYLLQLTPDYGLAEEILQNTLVAVWKSAHSFQARSSVLSWLIGIARRQAHNTLRRHKLPFVDESELAGDRTVLLSTHIVEDIAQTSRNLAIMKQGCVIFQGTTLDLLSEAQGKVWMITTEGSKPEGNFTVVATMHLGTSVQYRVVGDLSLRGRAVLIEPNLEDSYVWLMREQRTPSNSTSLIP